MGVMLEEGKTTERLDIEAQAEQVMLQYKQTNDLELRNQLVEYYSYIAKTVAAQTYTLSSNYAQVEDIVNEGIIAIINCVEKFDPSKGVSFKVYAFKRVRGAVIDFVRKQDWFPRRVRVNARNIMEAHDQLCNQLMREPTDQEMADRLGMTLAEYRKNSCEAANSLIFSFEGVVQSMATGGAQNEYSQLVAQGGNLPESSYAKKELREVLKDAISSLSEREQMVLSLYYFHNVKLSSIAKIMGVSDQRVSQINTRAVLKLKKIMADYIEGV